MSYNCPKCESEFEKGTKFCQTCGCNLEYIENPICPTCRTSYPTNTQVCADDGSKLVRAQDLIPKCVVCNTTYSEETKFCPRDGGEVKIILAGQLGERSQGTNQVLQKFGANGNYPKASLGNRFLAALLDGLISLGFSIPAIIFFVMGIGKMIDNYHHEEAGVLLIVAFLSSFLPLTYNFIKDGLGQGQSWGKMAVDLMVVNLDDHTPCNKRKSFVRNIISALVPVIPIVGWLIEPVMVLSTDDGRKLGDKAANTQVIEKRNF